VYYPGTQEIPPNAAPKILNRPHSVHALVEIPEHGAEGVLVSQGGVEAGFSFFMRDGRLHYAYNYLAEQLFHITSDDGIPSGRHILSFEFEPTAQPEPMKGKGAPGTIRLFVDGRQVGGGELPVTVPLTMGLGSGVAVGRDAGSPVGDGYVAPFPFTATLRRVAYDVSGQRVVDHEAELRYALAHQ